MEVLLAKVTQQAMNYAIRSGITITSGFAIQQCARLLKTVKGTERSELASLQTRLEGKIRIISPAIDMIELIAARGNTSLESAVTLTKALRMDIQSLGVRLSKAAGEEEVARRSGSKPRNPAQREQELKLIISDIKELLQRIEDAVPLINLAITTSGANLSTSLPATVSPSRLLQASTLLTAGDSQYAMAPSHAVQICPDFVLSMYMLFSAHAYRAHDDEATRETTWKEVMHKARLKLLRVPMKRIYEYPSDDGGPAHPHAHDSPSGPEKSTYLPAEESAFEYAYQLLVIEDLDDDRVHTFEDDQVQPGPYEGVLKAGMRELIPVHEISKIFYADTGKILNIGTEGEANNPILLLKRDVNAVPPRRMMQESDPNLEEEFEGNSSPPAFHSDEFEPDEQSELDEQLFREASATPSREKSPQPAYTHPWRLPPDLDPEWIAFEVYQEPVDPDSDPEESELEPAESSPINPRSRLSRETSSEPSLSSAFSRLHLWNSSRSPSVDPSPPTTPGRASVDSQVTISPQKQANASSTQSATLSSLPSIRTSLSLLEMLIRLTALQQFQQTSHLAIPDELLTFFLSESSTVGAGGDSELRKRVRRDARRRVGFDPYDESPIKRRTEQYLAEAAEHYVDDGGDYYERPGSSYSYSSEHALPRPSPSSRSYSSPSRQQHRQSSPSPARISGLDSESDIPQPSQELPPQNRASPSPLLRRATAPNAMVNPRAVKAHRFPHGIPTAPPTSSSPKHGNRSYVDGRTRIPETPERSP